MATLVSTGQLTIVDNNDARSITAFIAASGSAHQVYTKDESTISYTPDFVSANLTLTPKISIGGMTEAQAWACLTSKQFSLSAGGSALLTATAVAGFVNASDVTVAAPFTVTHAANGTATPSTLVVKANLTAATAVAALYFDADFTDPITGLVTHIVCSFTLSTVKTGTNAVFITLRGNNAIQQASTTTKNVTAVAADLTRSSGVDTSGLTYKWYEAATGTQISTSLSGYATSYGTKTTTGTPASSPSDLGVNVPTNGSGNAYNTLVISEAAVVDMKVFRVDITDADAKTYSQFFTVYDISDPYATTICSSAGDKLQNGVGSTNLTPIVYNGATKVDNLTGWSFDWYLYDRNGYRAAFVDTAKISAAGGAPITANTTGAAATFTYSGAAYTFAAGDVIKCVRPSGLASFYEVASVAGNVVTIRTPVTNTWLNFTNYPAPTTTADFVGGRLYGCTTQGKRSSSAAAAITVTGDEIDVKGTIMIESTRP